MKTGTLQTLHLKFLPTDSNHFFIGTNMVSIILSATKWCPDLLKIFRNYSFFKFNSCLGTGESWNESWFEGSTKVLQVSAGRSPTCRSQLNPLFSLHATLVLGESAIFDIKMTFIFVFLLAP